MYKPQNSNTLYCFSPAVMVITIMIEFGLVGWILSKYVLRTPQRLIVALLILLAAFQIAEFNVCTVHPIQLLWSRLGYAFITTLPALSLDLVIRLRGNARLHPLADFGYAMAAIFIIGFSFLPSAFNSGVCIGNYVIFLLTEPLSAFYGLYYLGLEILGLVLSFLPEVKAKAKNQSALRWIGIAYLTLMIPSFIIYIILPATRIAIPSIMCGFAVLFALIITLKVAPLMSKTR